MKANISDRNENESMRSMSVETSVRNIEEIKDDEEITIRIENVEDLIASASAASHRKGNDSH